jgi:hypothetical protein
MSAPTEDLERLVDEGELLYYSMARELGVLPLELIERLKVERLELPTFRDGYDPWYSTALRVVSRALPDRLDDFVAQYKNDKRRQIDYLTYTISDYLLDLKTTRGEAIIVDARAGLPKMQRQVEIVKAARQCFASWLLNVEQLLRADLLDAQLEAAAGLLKQGLLRGAGAIAGVVLAQHLGHVCAAHGLKVRRKSPPIAELDEALKDAGLLETPQWRLVQHLADLRALCDQKGEREPTKEDLAELLAGVAKVIKTVS